jgi:hypothetical protein
VVLTIAWIAPGRAREEGGAVKIRMRQLRDLAEVEKRIIGAAKAGFAGGFDHWTLIDTISHACAWKAAGLGKVESRIRGEEAAFHSGEPLEDINRRLYEEARGRSAQDALREIDRIVAREAEVLESLKGRESSVDLVPSGYRGTVSDYLAFDLIFHPVDHYAYYAIRNDEYEVFLEVERYVAANRSSAFSDMGVMDLKGYADGDSLKEIFDRGYEWQHDELFILLRSMLA